MRAVPYKETFITNFGNRIEEFKGAGHETIYCIGNGPSLKDQDPSKLPEGYMLGVNRAWQWRIPDAMVYSDSARFRESCRLGIDKIKVPTFLAPSALPLTEVNEEWARFAFGLHYMVPLQPGGEGAPLDDPSKGVNSLGGSVLFTSLQVALYMQPKRIVILGMDLDYHGGVDAYFYPHAPLPPGRNVSYVNARETIVKYQKACKRRGIELINATSRGNLHKIIPRISIEEL